MKRALIFGITGQLGSYLSELLLEKGYKVCGFSRHNTDPLYHFNHHDYYVESYTGDIKDKKSVHNAIKKVQPNEIYNMAGILRDESDKVIMDTNAIGVDNILKSVRDLELNCKIFQAGSSQMYKDKLNVYGYSKRYAFNVMKRHREKGGMDCRNGIFYHFTSPRDSEKSFARKVVIGAVKIKKGEQNELVLGNLDGRIDLGYAPEYAEASYRIMQYPSPKDFIILTRENHSLRDYVKKVFEEVGLDWEKYVKIDKDLVKPSGNDLLPIFPKYSLGWEPKIKFNEIIKILVKEEMDR